MCGLVLAGILLSPPLPVAAQRGRAAPVGRGLAEPPNARVIVSADTPQVRAGPRSVALVIVPVPQELPRDTAVTYEATPAGGMQFLGQRTGQVSGEAGVERIVALTVRVPAHTRAGREVAGRVRFFVDGEPRVDVVCTVDVPWVSGASMVLARRLLAARPGARVALHYRLTNSGNAPDMIEVVVTAPEHWGKGVLAVASVFHLLGGETTAEGDIVLAIPRDAATGSTWLPVVARNAAGDLAQVNALVEIVDGEAQPAAGVRLTPSIATVLHQRTPATPFFGLDFQGALTPGVRTFGRLVQGVNARPADARGLSQVGIFPGTSFATLEGARWRFTGGSTSEAFSEITGVNLWGRGATFAYGGTRWSTAAILATPHRFAGPSPGSGYMAGVQLGRSVGGAVVHGTAVAADDPQTGRQLDAFGIGGVAPPLGGGWGLSGEIAARRFRGGSGFGWLGEAKQQDADRLLLVRYAHAPGGSSAFAPARDLLIATVSDRATRTLRFGASLWGSADVTPTVERLRSSGWSAGPQWWVQPRTLLELELHGNGFDAAGASGVIGSSEVLARLGAMHQAGSFFGTASVAGGQVSRRLSTPPPGGAMNEVVAGRWLVRGSVGHSTAAGAFEASASYEQNGAGSGLLPQQSLFVINAAAVPLPVGLWGATGSASVQRYDWFGSRPGVTVVRAGFHVPLPAALALTLNAEHNPLFLSTAAGGWSIAIKLEYATVVPLTRLHAGARGNVFEDRNGNGQRDSGEPGLAGVLVRRGSESAITDRAGRYRFLTRADEPARLDEGSLPFGLIAPFTSSRSLDLAVLPTSPVTVRLVPTGDSGRAAPGGGGGSLATVRVQARDQAGNIWSARADTQGVAILHALPPGSYQIELDLTDLRVPLILRGPLPSFTIEAGGSVPTIVIPLFPRPVRMLDPSNPSRNRNQSGRP
jgi:hypothetical protein